MRHVGQITLVLRFTQTLRMPRWRLGLAAQGISIFSVRSTASPHAHRCSHFSISIFQNLWFSVGILPHAEGRTRRHDTLSAGCDGRSGSVRMQVRGRALYRGREVAWSWRPDAGVKFADAFDEARGRRWLKAGHRGEREVGVKTVAQGGPGCPSRTCGSCRLHFFRRRAMGAASSRPSLHPLDFRCAS